MSSAMHMDCIFYEAKVDTLGMIYTCFVADVRNSSENRLKFVQGDHLSGKKNVDLSGFEVENIKIPSIPSNLGKFVTNLKALAWIQTDLDSIKADDLKQFPHLIFLEVTRNLLTSLDSDLFKHNPNIKMINFENNRLSNIGESILDGLNHLTTVNFKSNYCTIDHVAHKKSEIKKIKKLIAENCSEK